MLYAVLLVVILIIFHNWFSFLPISAGDLGYFFKEHIVQYLNLPFMWETFRTLGFGGDAFLFQGVYFYNVPLGFLGHFFSYGVIERIIWFFPILVAGFIFPIILSRTVRIFPSRFDPLVSLVYFLNTYSLLIIAGGQLTVAFGYLAIPVVFASFIQAVRWGSIQSIILFSLLFSFLVSFDFRYAYIFAVLIFFFTLYSVIFIFTRNDLWVFTKRYLIMFCVSLGIFLCTHAFWLLPYLTNYHSPTAAAGHAYTSTDAVTYFSFAKFENSISLLHPLWPENVFGKVAFMKPEFLLLPILAFLSLIFIRKKKKSEQASSQATHLFAISYDAQKHTNHIVLFFILLGLIGAFLAKGVNPPFGEIYNYLFHTIPGFIMFRDPTKWYTLVALAYSIIIPFSIARIYAWLSVSRKFQISNLKFQINTNKKYFTVQNAFLFFVIGSLLLLISPAITGKLGGTLETVTVPQEYSDFKNFLFQDKNFSRVLWVPTMHRLTFYSNTHPGISGKDYFTTYDQYGVVTALQKNTVQQLLQDASVAYVVVPDDTQKEIYIKDREFDASEYIATVQALQKIPWLRQIRTFGKVVVFAVADPKPHFWSNSDEARIIASFINPTEYSLRVENGKKGDRVVFVESYSEGWFLKDQNRTISSERFDSTYNSFILPRTGTYTVKVYYKPQLLVPLGLVISGISLLTSISILAIVTKYSVKKK